MAMSLQFRADPRASREPTTFSYNNQITSQLLSACDWQRTLLWEPRTNGGEHFVFHVPNCGFLTTVTLKSSWLPPLDG